MNKHDTVLELSVQAIGRMPYYLDYLNELYSSGVTTVSAPNVAAHFGFSEIQVRKDFSAVSSIQGRPKHGFSIPEIIDDMEMILGYRNCKDAVLVGAGSLGTALLEYDGFNKYGIDIVAAFDSDPAKAGGHIGEKQIFPSERISELCLRMNIHIGIITVPAAAAQDVCDRLVAGGVKAIWNFAPKHLSVPDGILVQNENMAASLALLSKHLMDEYEEIKA